MATKSPQLALTDVTATAEVQQLIKQPESSELEFKARVNLPVLLQTICAFANGGGGSLLIGVSDTKQVLGVPDASAVREKLLQQLQNQLSPPPNASVIVTELEGKQLLLLEVAPGRDRPYISQNTIYVRRGGTTAKASPAEIVQLINGLDSIPRWEAASRVELTLDDLDSVALAETREAANRLRFAALPDDNSQMLERLHLIRNGLLTNAAAVLFAPAVAKIMPQTQLRAVRYTHNDSRDELLDNQLFSGHAFELLAQALRFLEGNLSVAAAVPAAGTLVRADRLAYPLVAVREGLLNAIVHRDYEQFEGGITLALYPHRLEIWNTGWLPTGVTVKSLREGGSSHPRNPDIARVLMMRGLVERVGSGGPRIVALCKEAGLPAPQWQEKAGGVLFTLYSEPVASRSTASLNERITKFLAETTPGHKFTVADYQRQTGAEVSDRRSRTDLTQMIEAGAVIRQGKGKNTFYVRAEE